MFTTLTKLSSILVITMVAVACTAQSDPMPAGSQSPAASEAPSGAGAGTQAPPSSQGSAVTGADLSQKLNACGLPQPCSWPIDTGAPEQADGVRCVISELTAGHTLRVETLLVADGGDTGCQTHQVLEFFASAKTAYYLQYVQCGATEKSHTLRRCNLLGHDAYASCLASFDASRKAGGGIECSLATEWVTGCTDVDAVTCP
jgi:hypothetical protein